MLGSAFTSIAITWITMLSRLSTTQQNSLQSSNIEHNLHEQDGVLLQAALPESFPLENSAVPIVYRQ